MSTLGELIREKRNEKGLGLRELARNADISHSYLSQIENGNKKEPKSYILRALAQELDLDYKELLTKAGYNTDWKYLDQITKEKIEDQLKLLIDNEGYFYDFLREDLFKAITANLYMATAYHESGDDKEYEDFFNHYYSVESDELSERDHEEAEEMFNKAYDMRTVLKAINSSSTNISELEKFHSTLEEIIKKHNISSHKESKLDTDLNIVLKKPKLAYNGHLITDNDKQLIKSYLDALFSGREDK